VLNRGVASLNCFLKIYGVFLFAASASQVAAEIAKSQPSAGRAAVDLQILGSGTPVGVQGLYFMYGCKPEWELEFGVGRGTVGNHVSINSRHFLHNNDGNRQNYWLVGASYSGGIRAKRAEKDYDLNGAVGMEKQVADALWLNTSYGYIFRTESGFRFLLDAGIALAIVTEIKVKAEDATETRNNCDFFSCEAPTIRTGSLSPAITIVRAGYAF
jgi:hypothetical protein